MPNTIDVGARGGLHQRWRDLPFPVRSVLFEPDPAAATELEVEFRPVYDGQPLFADVDAFMTDAGFELCDLDRCYRTRGEELLANQRRGQLVWGDALYLRPPETVLAFPDLTADKIVRAAEFVLAYGYTDVATVLIDRPTAEGGLHPAAAEPHRVHMVLLTRAPVAVGRLRRTLRRRVLGRPGLPVANRRSPIVKDHRLGNQSA